MATPYRILLADDDYELRSGVADLLASLGLEILQAESGDEAIALARRFERLHAALLDMHMPGCTGLEALPLLRALRRGLPCILVSGDWTSDLRERVRQAGAFSVLEKPLEPVLLRREVLRAVETWPGGYLGPERN